MLADPLATSPGHAAGTRGVQERFPGLGFRLDGKADGDVDRMRCSWSLGSKRGDALVKGTDFAIVANGKLAAVSGFIDQMPTA